MRKIILFAALAIAVFCGNVYSRDLDAVKLNFLKGDYKAAILEGEKILACSKNFAGCDELYYFMGLSYLKDGNFLRASDIFEIIIKEFPESHFKEKAKLGLGDAYFYLGDHTKAKGFYMELVNANPGAGLKPSLYYRLSQVGLKEGDNAFAKEYLDKLKHEYPLSPEAKADNELLSSPEIYYTVQVGSFSNSSNASNLTQKLTRDGYPAYLEELKVDDAKTTYRVRVGKFNMRQQAEDLEKKLSQEGYPTKIFP